MTTVNNNAANAGGVGWVPWRELEKISWNRDFDPMVQNKAGNNISSKDVSDDLSKMFKQDTELSQPARQAVDSLMGELSGMKESVNDLLGQLVDKVKSGNHLSDLASPFSSENPMSSEKMSEVVSAVLSELSGMGESTDELLGQLEGSIRDAISNPMSSDTSISDIAKAVLEGISDMSGSADDLLGKLVDTFKADTKVLHQPVIEPPGHLPDHEFPADPPLPPDILIPFDPPGPEFWE
jgi:hypothetical protein